MNSMKKSHLLIVFSIALFVSCNNTVPSSHEIHYSKGLTDSIVFVNYNISSDSSCNFYMDYKEFRAQFHENNYESVYKYHCAHPVYSRSIDYTTYRRKEFYTNNNPDTAVYYQSGSSSSDQTGNSSLKPTNPSTQTTRPYNYRKTK